MVNIDTKWNILFTKPGCEKKVAKLLSKKNIENYCPLNRMVHKRRGMTRKMTAEPLFASFVFARMKESRHEELRNMESVINFLYWKDKLAEIGDIEIEMIRFFLNAHINVHIEKAPVNVKDVVRFISEPSIGREGNLMSIKINTEKVLLPSIGYLLTAVVEKNNVHEFPDSEHVYRNENGYKLAINKQ